MYRQRHNFMPKITFKYGDQVQEVEVTPGESILQIALDNGVPIEHACGGNGFCTTCMCKITKGIENLSSRNEREEQMGVVEDPDRLSCQSVIEGDGEIIVELQDF